MAVIITGIAAMSTLLSALNVMPSMSYVVTPELGYRTAQAMYWLGRLEEAFSRSPHLEALVKAYAIKEAISSSEIEGIRTNLIDVFSAALGLIEPTKDLQFVLNYVRAQEEATILMKQMPLCNRLVLEAHKSLMTPGGDYADPGNFRRLGVRVGSHIPPQAQQVPSLMAELEVFVNVHDPLPLVKAGISHVAFETIHPFLDGNGRIGRLLIILMLMNDGVISRPLLYPSLFFKKRQMPYYRFLDGVRMGKLGEWIDYYLEIMLESSRDAWLRLQDIEQLDHKLQRLIESQDILPNKREQMLQVLKILFRYPVITMNQLSQQMGKSYTSASNMMDTFVELGVLQATGDQQRNKLFTFRAYLDLLEKEYTFADSPEILYHP